MRVPIFLVCLWFLININRNAVLQKKWTEIVTFFLKSLRNSALEKIYQVAYFSKHFVYIQFNSDNFFRFTLNLRLLWPPNTVALASKHFKATLATKHCSSSPLIRVGLVHVNFHHPPCTTGRWSAGMPWSRTLCSLEKRTWGSRRGSRPTSPLSLSCWTWCASI